MCRTVALVYFSISACRTLCVVQSVVLHLCVPHKRTVCSVLWCSAISQHNRMSCSVLDKVCPTQLCVVLAAVSNSFSQITHFPFSLSLPRTPAALSFAGFLMVMLSLVPCFYFCCFAQWPTAGWGPALCAGKCKCKCGATYAPIEALSDDEESGIMVHLIDPMEKGAVKMVQ